MTDLLYWLEETFSKFDNVITSDATRNGSTCQTRALFKPRRGDAFVKLEMHGIDKSAMIVITAKRSLKVGHTL